MPEILDRLGLTDEALIEKQLVSLLEATEAKFFPWRRKRKDGRIEQMIEQRHVAALGTRMPAIDMVFNLKGSYAPKQIEIDPDDPSSVTVIDVSAIPKHG